ncbi:MAG: hypothetical protein M3Y88_08020, partial [Chloroflexota bacterium]|nr:hypothetical protein [Chloroflexota bacterium]
MDDRQFEARLADRLREYEANLPDADAPDPRGASRHKALSAVAIAGTGLLAAVLAAVILGQSPRQAGNVTPIPSGDAASRTPLAGSPQPAAGPGSPNATPTPGAGTPAPTSARPLAGVSWDRSAIPVGGGQVQRVVADRGRFYALGSTGSQQVAIWSSSDGVTWQRALLPFPSSWTNDPSVAVDAEHLVSSRGRLIVLGSANALDNRNIIVWESADGIAWTEVNTGSFRTAGYRTWDLTDGPAGLVAATGGFAAGSGSAWLSTDGGRTWEEHRPATGGLQAYAVVGTSAGYLLAGAAQDGPIEHPRIWASSDGKTWTERSVRGGDGAGRIGQLAVNGVGQWVATGVLNGRAVAWRSEDARNWTLAADFGPDPSTVEPLTRLVGAPGGFVALRVDLQLMTTWTSVDGWTWTRRQDPVPKLP